MADRLDELKEWALREGATRWPSGLAARDVLALVEVARAARELADYVNDEPGPYVLVRLDELKALRAALARLDGAA